MIVSSILMLSASARPLPQPFGYPAAEVVPGADLHRHLDAEIAEREDLASDPRRGGGAPPTLPARRVPPAEPASTLLYRGAIGSFLKDNLRRGPPEVRDLFMPNVPWLDVRSR